MLAGEAIKSIRRGGAQSILSHSPCVTDLAVILQSRFPVKSVERAQRVCYFFLSF